MTDTGATKAKRLVPPAFRPAARRVLRRINLAVGPSRTRRRRLDVEAKWWRDWFDLPEANPQERLDPAINDPIVLECLARLPGNELSLIDVGAGPLSTLGTQAPGKRVRLTAVDPLADRFDDVLQEVGITPLVRTEPCAGEELMVRFQPETFDLAFAENALDHAVNPLLIVRNMVELVRSGGFVVLNHAPNEGERSAYGHLHQWNFRERNGRCLLWRPGIEHDLGETLESVSVRCTVEQRSDGPRVICVLEKA